MARAWQGRSPGLPLSGRGASCHVSVRVIIPISALPPERNTLPPFRLIAAAFAIVYLGYGLNFLAVKIAVETLPAFLFAGSHVLLAGLIIMGWRLARGGSLALPRGGMRRAGRAAFFLFVGGVGLVTLGEKLGLASGAAAMIMCAIARRNTGKVSAAPIQKRRVMLFRSALSSSLLPAPAVFSSSAPCHTSGNYLDGPAARPGASDRCIARRSPSPRRRFIFVMTALVHDKTTLFFSPKSSRERSA